MVETPETAAIEQDLAQTRARMDHHLDELQDRLSPSQVLNDALSYFQRGNGSDFAQDLIRRAKANPLPVVVTGVGLIWLLASSGRSAVTRDTPHISDMQRKLRQAESEVKRGPQEDAVAHASRIDEARGRVLGITKAASDTSQSYAERIKSAMSDAAQSLRETAHDMTDNVGTTMGSISDQAQRSSAQAQQRMNDMAQSARGAIVSVTENPLAMGAVAVVLGIVVGALIPTSDQEERALGSTADRLRSAGSDLAQDVVDKGGEAVNEALDAAKDSAAAHGLSTDKPVGELVSDLQSGKLADAVKSVVSETLDAGKDSVQSNLGSNSRPIS